MAQWIEPVYDRTHEDVEFATRKIAEWVSAVITGQPLIVYDLKGCLNVTDINRIETDIAYLSERLGGYYYRSGATSKVWDKSGIPDSTDTNRIINNVKSMIKVFCQKSTAPPVPNNLLGYEEVNAIEKNLALIKELIEYMVSSFKYCGVTQSGQSYILPMRG